MSIPYEPLWAYLYLAIFLGGVSAIMLITLWWLEARKSGVARRRIKHIKYLKLLDDYREGQAANRPYSPYTKVNRRLCQL